MTESDLLPLLQSIAASLERLAPKQGTAPDLWAADAFVWHSQGEWLEPIPNVNRVDIELLRGIDQARDILIDNTRRFAAGLPANNALLWGARGTGKSSLVKAAHAAVNREAGGKKDRQIALVEIHREDLASLPSLLKMLRDSDRRCLLFCDDLSFDSADTSYKSLKAVLEGGIEGRPANVLFYATSNRRHLMPRDMIDNERSTAINPSRGGRGEGVAVGSLRPVARLPQLRPGHLLRDHRGLCEALRPLRAQRNAAGGSGGMVGHPRRPLRPRRLAVHPGSRRTAGQEDRELGRARTTK